MDKYSEKKYLSISEVSTLLNINKHVIRYWDAKFKGISTRMNDKKQRFFNQDNIKKLKELKSVLYQDGKHNYSLDLALKIVNKKSKNLVNNNEINNIKSNNIQANIMNRLKEISNSLKKIL